MKRSLILGLCLLVPSALAWEVERLATGFANPIYLTHAPGDEDRLFVVEQGGLIRILDRATGQIAAAPFLDVKDLSSGGERGLLGLAFHPDYARNGRFFVNLTRSGGDSQLREYRVSSDPQVADPNSRRDLLTIAQPRSNHNGGWLAFGPDGYLYTAIGDGGGGNDPDNAGQTLTSLLGKVLRIDVDGDDFPGDADRNYAIPPGNPFVGRAGENEIWAWGLRNPWRCSFDRLTGDLWIADVGQGAREEVNVQPPGSPGINYGWRLREGTIRTPSVGGDRPEGAVDPIYDYRRGTDAFEGFSVTGGYVYRGPIQSLQGQYFFADFGSAGIWSLRWDGSPPAAHDGTNYTELTDRTAEFIPDAGTVGSIASFGEDALGNLYVVDRGGEIFWLRPDPEDLAPPRVVPTLPPVSALLGAVLLLVILLRLRGRVLA